jgi:hypothetical protein
MGLTGMSISIPPKEGLKFNMFIISVGMAKVNVGGLVIEWF